MEIVALLAAGLCSVFLNLFASELWCRGPSFAKWLIVRAARRLPVQQRERYEEEWLAHLDECLGNFSKVRHALECMICVRALKKVALSQVSFALQLATEDGRDWAVGFNKKTITVDVPTLRFIVGMLKQLPRRFEETGTKINITGLDDILLAIAEDNANGKQPNKAQVEKFIELLGSAMTNEATKGRP
jgi:hypothetical protein